MNLFVFVFMVSMLGVMYAAYNFHTVLNMKEGTKQMVEIAAAIRVGANTFLYKEYRILIFVVTALSLVFGLFIQWSSMVAFIIGVFVSEDVAINLFRIPSNSLIFESILVAILDNISSSIMILSN